MSLLFPGYLLLLSLTNITLDVVIANDPELPPVTREDAAIIMAEAKKTVADKLGYEGLTFRVVGEKSVEAFLDEHAPKGGECLESFAPVRVVPGKKRAVDVDRKAVVHFLERWSLNELRSFFDAKERAALTSHEVIAAKLAAELDRKLELIASLTLENGASILAPDKLDERSYVRFVCAMRAQNEADLVLTNAFILYDLGSEPYPHSVFQKNKVGGASLASPRRQAIPGRALVSSTFSMITSLPFFREDGVEGLSPRDKLEVIGAFILAHELGHALFKLPDFYDHPKECLMTTKHDTGYVSGYWRLLASPGPCPACAPWVEAKRHVFAAEDKRQRGDTAGAIASLKEAIRKTPRHIDGSYKRYLADLSCDIAELYEKSDRAEAMRWLKSVLRLVPDHERAQKLNETLNPPPR